MILRNKLFQSFLQRGRGVVSSSSSSPFKSGASLLRLEINIVFILAFTFLLLFYFKCIFKIKTFLISFLLLSLFPCLLFCLFVWAFFSLFFFFSLFLICVSTWYLWLVYEKHRLHAVDVQRLSRRRNIQTSNIYLYLQSSNLYLSTLGFNLRMSESIKFLKNIFYESRQKNIEHTLKMYIQSFEKYLLWE